MTADRECSVPGCGHVHDLQCLLMSVASGGLRRVGNLRRTAPYGWPGVEILDESFHERAGLWDELQTTVVRLSRTTSSSSPVGKASEAPVPYHARASAVAHRMRNELTTWTRVLHHPPLALPADHPPAIARWLAMALADTFVTAEMGSGIRAVVRDAERVIDHAPDRVFAGPCLEPLTDKDERLLAADAAAVVDRCSGQLFAAQGKSHVTCRECGARHNVSTRQDWLSTQLGPSLVTAAEAAPVLSWLLDKPIKVDTIHKWRTRAGRLLARGEHLGRPLYRFSELHALAIEVKTRESKPRKEGSAA